MMCTLGIAATTAVLWPTEARAGVPECGGVWVDADAACSLEVAIDCDAQCDLDGAIRACANELAIECSGGCDFDLDIQCSSDCGATCETQCLQGDVKCHDNCYPECTVECPDRCSDADDPAKCRAGCEANCNTTCDEKCGELTVDASCEEHCNMCCIGSCTASANLDCQLDCQGLDFAGCQQSFVERCEVGCGGSGSVFCDGQIIAAGEAVSGCADALARRGVDVEVDVDVDLPSIDGDTINDPFGGGCAFHTERRGRGDAMLALFVLVAGAWGRRRRG